MKKNDRTPRSRVRGPTSDLPLTKESHSETPPAVGRNRNETCIRKQSSGACGHRNAKSVYLFVWKFTQNVRGGGNWLFVTFPQNNTNESIVGEDPGPISGEEVYTGRKRVRSNSGGQEK